MAAQLKAAAPRSNRDKAAAIALADSDQPTSDHNRRKPKKCNMSTVESIETDFIKAVANIFAGDKQDANTVATMSTADGQSEAPLSGFYEDSMFPEPKPAASRPPSPVLSSASTPVLGMPPSHAGDEVESQPLTSENVAVHVAAEEEKRNRIAENNNKEAGDEDDEIEGRGASAMERELASSLSAAGKFDLRTTAAGRLWLRRLRDDADFKRRYATITGYSAQREFRATWLQGEYDKVKAERTSRSSFTTCETDRGEYEPFSRIWKLEGKDEAALLATRHYVEACTDLGGRWIKFNTFTKHAEHLYMKQGYREGMTEAYTRVTTELQNGIVSTTADGKDGSADVGLGIMEGRVVRDPQEQKEEQNEEPKKARLDKAKKVPTEAELKLKELERV